MPRGSHVRHGYKTIYSSVADKPSDLENFNMLVAIFVEKTSVTAILNEFLERDITIIRRWEGCATLNEKKGHLVAGKLSRYQQWLECQ